MGNDRYRQDQRDFRDYGNDRNDRYSGSQGYGSADYRDDDRGGYGFRSGQQGQNYGGGYGSGGGFDRQSSDYYGGRDQQHGYGGGQYGGGSRDSYGSGGQRYGQDRDRGGQRDYGRSRDHDNRERGFLDRAGDEVRSWFGDDEAERRREQDARLDQQRDHDYRSWRSGQIAALDRDYDEYRQEHRSKFENEFSSWRTERQGQRSSLGQVSEHMDVVGSDGSHVGTVDKVRGDRIVLTKNDQDAGGRHHSIPSRWIQSVDDKVTLRKTADEAKSAWRDEERNQSFFADDRDDDRNRGKRDIGDDRGGHMLNRSFSGTY